MKKAGFETFLTTLSLLDIQPGVHFYQSQMPLVLKLVKDACNENANFQTTSFIETEQLLTSKFIDQWRQESLFEDASLFICFPNQVHKKLLEQLTLLHNLKGKNALLVLSAQKIPANKKKLGFSVVSCPEPAPYEFETFIRYHAKQQGIKFDKSACDLLIEHIGKDLSLLANEINRLALILAPTPPSVSAGDISHLLGVLREDIVFRLNSYLCEKKTSQALVLLADLLRRGESSLAILGLIAKHCRSAIVVWNCLKKGESPHEISSKAKLPKYLIAGYTKYVKSVGETRLIDSLSKCSLVDRKLKTGRFCEEALLSDLVFRLS